MRYPAAKKMSKQVRAFRRQELFITGEGVTLPSLQRLRWMWQLEPARSAANFAINVTLTPIRFGDLFQTLFEATCRSAIFQISKRSARYRDSCWPSPHSPFDVSTGTPECFR